MENRRTNNILSKAYWRHWCLFMSRHHCCCHRLRRMHWKWLPIIAENTESTVMSQDSLAVSDVSSMYSSRMLELLEATAPKFLTAPKFENEWHAFFTFIARMRYLPRLEAISNANSSIVITQRVCVQNVWQSCLDGIMSSWWCVNGERFDHFCSILSEPLFIRNVWI